MNGSEQILGGDGRAAAAILFLAAGTNAMDVYSALNSSPWTAESFGGTPEKARACKEYVAHGAVATTFFCTVSAIVARSWWPILGALLANAYMVWLYMRALNRAQRSGSKGWDG